MIYKKHDFQYENLSSQNLWSLCPHAYRITHDIILVAFSNQ